MKKYEPFNARIQHTGHLQMWKYHFENMVTGLMRNYPKMQGKFKQINLEDNLRFIGDESLRELVKLYLDPRTSHICEQRVYTPGFGHKMTSEITTPIICGGCKNMEKDVQYKVCNRCKSVYYCSRKCQKKHWKNHKKECRSLKATKI